jgi:hypothetical protein
MKVGEFCNAIGVSNKSYNDFLRQNGPYKGSGNSTYHNGWAFFKKRQLKGKPSPRKKCKAAPAKEAAASLDVSSISLEGEETDSVGVYGE